MNTRLIPFLLALAALAPGVARAAGHWRLQPTLTLSLRHDDNPFVEPERTEAAGNLGIEPSLVLLRHSSRARVSLHVAQAAERYADHPEIDTLGARQTLALRADAHVTRRWSAGLALSQLRTAAAAELDDASPIDLGRRAARRRQLAATTTYAVSRSATFTGELTATHDAVQGAAALSGTTGVLRVDQRGVHESRLSLLYQWRRHAGGGGGSVSHRLGCGFERPLGRAIELAAEAGPRIARGGSGVEWMLRARLHTRRSEVRGEWSDGESAVVGRIAPAIVRRAGVSCATVAGVFHGRAALDRLRSRGGMEATLLRASFEVTYRPAAPVSVVAAASRSRQQDDLRDTRRGSVRRTVLELRVVVTPTAPRKEGHVGR
jgi:hypothetical protein